jgi:predicted membrane protein
MSLGRWSRVLLWWGGVLLISLPHSAAACSACFGKSDSALAKGMNAGIFTLLFIVTFVLIGFAAFLVFLVKRSAMIAESSAAKTASAEVIANKEAATIHE